MGWRDFVPWLLGRDAAPVEPEQRMFDPANWGIPAPGAGAGGTFASTVAELRTGAESSLQAVAVWSACDLLASVSSQIPVDTYRRGADGRGTVVSSPRQVEDPAGDGYGAPDWIYQYLMSKLLRGNTYGTVPTRDGRSGRPLQVVLYHPDTVRGWRDRISGTTVWSVQGQRVDEVWHRRSYPMPGTLLGMSPVEKHAATIGQSMAATRFGLQWFEQGAHPTGLLTNSEVEINGEQAREVKSRWLSRGTREPAVMGMGWAFKQLQVSPNESQFLETGKYSAAECARIFGPNVAEILGYDSGTSMTYKNMVDRDMAFLKYTLNRWLRDVEAVFDSMLTQPLYTKFNRGALLEMDLLSRYKAHATGISAGFLHPDEARDLEDRPPLTPAQKADLAAMTVKMPPDIAKEA